MRIFKVISIQNKDVWDEVVQSMPNVDIYYMREYMISLQIHGDGEPLLIYYESDIVKVCLSAMIRDIAHDNHFYHVLNKNSFFDLETPYGYGGPMVEGNFSKEEQLIYVKLLDEYCREKNIVSIFFRFHPLLENHKYIYCFDKRAYLKNTVYLDLHCKETIIENMDSKNRNMIRKAIKNNIEIVYDKGERLSEFFEIYNTTMNYKNAVEYYYFSVDYFEFLIKNMSENTIFFYSILNDQIVGAAIFLYNKKYMHYHLSGTLPMYRNLASTNLLIYNAALWGHEYGLTKLHLGGGISDNDTLFGFKKQFNKYGQLPFYVGRRIFSQESYRYLLNLRKLQDTDFEIDNNYMIQYRK